MERKRTRSDSYQHLLLEIIYPHEMLAAFSNDDSLHKRLNPFAYNEDVLVLEDQLKDEFWRVVNENLTPRQNEVIRLCSQGLTQMEIAKKLGVNQSSITKSLNGNVDYSKDEGRRSYGGIKKKLQKIIETDDKIQKILKKINELRDEDYI